MFYSAFHILFFDCCCSCVVYSLDFLFKVLYSYATVPLCCVCKGVFWGMGAHSISLYLYLTIKNMCSKVKNKKKEKKFKFINLFLPLLWWLVIGCSCCYCFTDFDEEEKWPELSRTVGVDVNAVFSIWWCKTFANISFSCAPCFFFFFVFFFLRSFLFQKVYGVLLVMFAVTLEKKN